MRSFTSYRVLIATIASVVLLASHLQAASKSTPLMTMNVRGPFVIVNQAQLYCDVSYSVTECRKEIEVLRQALQPYPLTLLPNWKWVLVRADQWKSLTNSLHTDHGSPAVTFLDDSTTLLEESLISPAAERAAELINSYKIDLHQLLDVAISHELGHAICHEHNEFRADSTGRDIRRQIAAGQPVSVRCLQPTVPNAHEGR